MISESDPGISEGNPGRDAELIEQYIALEQSRDSDAESWPVEALRRIVPREPGRAWLVLKSLIRDSPDELPPRVGERELAKFVTLHGVKYAKFLCKGKG